MEIAPVTKNINLKQKAYETIKHAIYTNAIAPGEALTEESLSAQLQISRTPIRSALQQLVFEKLASKDDTGHIYVSKISEKDVDDITVMRLNLEPLAIEHTQFPIPEERLTKVKEVYQRQLEAYEKTPDDNILYAQLDTEFHSCIAQLSDNGILTETVSNINNMMIRINILSGALHQNMEQALKEHEAIVSYLENNQKSFAKLTLTEHISNVSHRLLP